MVWAGKLAGHREMSRVYGPDLMLDVCAWSETSGAKHFFLRRGGRRGGAAGAKIKIKISELQVAGILRRRSARSTRTRKKIAEQVGAARPDIFWSPEHAKQEKFMAEFLPKLDATLMIGVARRLIFTAAACGRRRAGCSAAGWNGFTACAASRAGWRSAISATIRCSR